MISDPGFYAIAVPVVFLIGLSKGGFLGGIAILGVPLFALAIPPVQAAAILLPILIAMDAIGVWTYRRSVDKANLMIMVPAATLGVAIGWMTAAYVSESHVRLIVGLVALAFTLDHWLGIRPQTKAQGPDPLKGGFWGTLAGFTSFVSHAGSPPVQIYLLPQRLERTVYVGTSVVFFALVNLIKVPPYFLLGQFTGENLAATAVLLPLAPLAIALGIFLVRRVPQEPFYRIAYACVFLVSLKLIWDGSRALLGL
jgi:hypothetical protein